MQFFKAQKLQKKNSDNFGNVKVRVVFQAKNGFTYLKFGCLELFKIYYNLQQNIRWSKVGNIEGSMRKCASPVTTFHDVFAFLTSYFQKSTEVVSGTNSTFWWFHVKFQLL